MIKGHYIRRKRPAKKANDWISFVIPKTWKTWVTEHAENKKISASEWYRQAVQDRMLRENPSLVEIAEDALVNG